MKTVYNKYTCLVLSSYVLALSTAAVVKLPLYKSKLGLKRASPQQDVSFNKLGGHVQDPIPHVPVISDLQNLAIYTHISVGTPVQTFKVTIATQNYSSDFWVLSTDCTNAGCDRHTKYNHSLSTTYVSNGTQYNDGLTSGYLSQDTVTIAGLTVVGQVFGEATTPQSFDVLSEPEGYLCLGLNNSAATGTPSLLFNLLKQNLIQESVFGIYMAPFNTSVNSTSGGLILGGRDPNHYIGELIYTPLTSKDNWQFKMNSVSIKSKLNTPAGCQSGCTAVIQLDSSEPFIIGPTKEVDALNKKLGAIKANQDGISIYYFDCSSIKMLPTILLNIEGVKFELKPEQYVLNYSNELCLSNFISDTVSQWSLGAPFLEAIYTEFDVGNSRLGFAPAKYSD